MQLLTTTFLFTIIHEDSTSENGSFSIISFTELSAKKLFLKGNLENKSVILCLELAFTHKALVLIPTCIGNFTDLFRDISLNNET